MNFIYKYAMWDKVMLNNFTKQATKAWLQFCVYKYMNNYFVTSQKDFKKTRKPWLYSTEEAINNSAEYKNFFTVVIPSLQHSRVLSVARLLDPAYFRKDKTKPNLSIHYILESLEDIVLKKEVEKELNKHNRFVTSISNIRTHFIAHNSLGIFRQNIEAGIEDFFEALDGIIHKIIDRHTNLKWCNGINLDFSEKLSEAGVKDIFSKLIIK